MRLKAVLPLLAALCLLVPTKAHASADPITICTQQWEVRDQYGRPGMLWYCVYYDPEWQISIAWYQVTRLR